MLPVEGFFFVKMESVLDILLWGCYIWFMESKLYILEEKAHEK